MRHKFTKPFYRIFALALIALLAMPIAAFASSIDVAVVDVLAPTGSVTVAPGASASITINMVVTGKQETEATFQVFRDWSLSAGTFTGSNAQTFTVHPRTAQDTATTFTTTGNISVVNGQTVGTFTLKASAINITNTGTGAKLSDGADSSYVVTVSAPELLTTTTAVTCPASVTYTGAAIEPCSATVTGAGGLNQSLTVSYSNNTAVGPATASASFAGNSTYAASSDSKTFTIAKASSTVTVNCSDVTYTGAAIEPCTAAVTGVGGLNQPLTVSYNSNTNAGTATASASYGGDASHTGNTNSATFDIAKATSSTSLSCPGSVTYTGAAQAPCTASYSGVGGLSGTLTPTYSNNTNAGPASATANFAGDSNHASSANTASFTIDKAASETNITCPTSSVEYTGAAIEPCTATVTGAGGLNQPLTVNYSGNTDAGPATASASYAGDANHTNSSSSISFQIGSVGSITTIDCPASVTYNGSAQTPCTANVTGVGGLNQSVTVVYTNNTNAGTATAKATFASDGNHDGSFAETTFAIDKADATITVKDYNGVYDRTAHGASGTATGIGGENPGTLDLGASFTNVPGGTAHWIFTANGNYNNASGNAAIVITKANATIPVSGYTGMYDGSAHGATGSATGIGGENPGTLDLGASFINVPGGTANWTFTGDANYNDANGDVAIVIGKATSTTTITCPVNVTYNGSAQTPCTAKATGAGGLNNSVAVNYSNNIDAGSATATANYAGDTNHDGSADTASFTIAQASSTVTLSCPASVTYTGSALEPCTAKATGAGGLDTQVSIDYSNNINAGTASALASYTGDSNHTGNIDSAIFEIGKAASTTTVTCAAGPFTYNGAAQAPCSASVTGVGGLNQTLTVSYSDNTNAGTATASASYGGDDNHTGSSGSKTFTIAKASSTTTVTCTAGPFTYTGSAQTPCMASYSTVDGLSGSLTVSYSNNTAAGTAAASASYVGDSNHEASSDSKNFMITKASSTTSVTCAAGPFTYTGSPLTPCSARVTGAGGLDQPLTVSYSNNTAAGTATASASYAGDTNHEASSNSKNFTIDKAASTTIVNCPASVTYTGAAQTPCTTSYSGAGGLSGTLTPSYMNNVVGTATASATYAGDANHNGSSDSKTFNILYSVSGTCLGAAGHSILQPINADGSSIFKLGSTAPAKFRVCDSNGASVGTAGLVTSFKLTKTETESSSVTVNEDVIATTPDAAFRWDASAQQWIFNISTKGLKSLTKYTYTITLNDGSTIVFSFGLK